MWDYFKYNNQQLLNSKVRLSNIITSDIITYIFYKNSESQANNQIPDFNNSNIPAYLTGEDICEVNDKLKDISETNFLQQDISLKPGLKPDNFRPIYLSGGIITDSTLDKKGSITISNVTYKDTLRHFEFIDLCSILFNSKFLLTTGSELTKNEEKQKRKLLGLLVNINYNVSDLQMQSRLMRCVEDRISLAANYLF